MRPSDRINAVHLHKSDPLDQGQKVSTGLLLTGVFRQGMPRKKQVPGGLVVDDWACRAWAHADIGSAPHRRRQWIEPRLPIGSIEREQIDHALSRNTRIEVPKQFSKQFQCRWLVLKHF